MNTPSLKIGGIDLSGVLTATDFDGDTVTGAAAESFVINVQDDIPVAALNPAVQAASVAAWNDEEHVEENRRLYRDKFARITPMLQPYLPVALPDAGFYYWVRTPIPDTEFARRLQAEYNVTVLPGSYLAREANGVNPGAGFVRIALVADTHECVEAAGRIIDFCKTL